MCPIRDYTAQLKVKKAEVQCREDIFSGPQEVRKMAKKLLKSNSAFSLVVDVAFSSTNQIPHKGNPYSTKQFLERADI